jgi:glycosyltransferase involved in cell wall biosynthesis
MRVLHLGVGNLFGGIESMLLTLARSRHLCPEMQPSFTVCFEGRLSEESRSAGVPVHRLGATRYARPWTVWAARWRLSRLLKRERFDVVVDHGPWTRGLFGRVLRRHGLPVAFWLHNPAEGKHWLERKASKYPPERVIANSRFTEASADQIFPGVPTEVIYPPVAPPGLPTRSREEVRRDLGTDTKAFVIVIACRLEEWKGHRSLLEALVRLKDVPNWVCWVAGGAQREGEKGYLGELQSESVRHGVADRVRWLGQRKDVPDLLAAADLHCQPNQSPEPFGISFIEALYAGLPVVSTAIGGAVEIISEECGELVVPGRVDLLAEAIRKRMGGVVADTTRALRAKRAADLCDPARQLRRLSQALEAVASGRVGTNGRGSHLQPA